MSNAHLPQEIRNFIRANALKVAVAIAALLLFSFVFHGSIKAAVIIPILVLAASFSTFYFNYISLPVNFELVKLATILTAASYGFLPGIAVGIASTFFGKVLIGRIDEKLPLSMLAISLVSLAASMLHSIDVTMLGIALVLAYNTLMLMMSIMMGGDLAWNLPYEASNFFFNLLLFTKVAPLLLQVMRP
ncbi:MAG TPA: hypothetical protein VI934_03395 [Candidatus Nanoarchaeia archaeon]|nr:hypothetical protein [Candidatus Nanoarchaeia archaeon]